MRRKGRTLLVAQDLIAYNHPGPADTLDSNSVTKDSTTSLPEGELLLQTPCSAPQGGPDPDREYGWGVFKEDKGEE